MGESGSVILSWVSPSWESFIIVTAIAVEVGSVVVSAAAAFGQFTLVDCFLEEGFQYFVEVDIVEV